MEKDILTRGVEEIINREHLAAALKSGKKLRVKFGIDPTAADLHLGHTVPLRQLRQFQNAGHQIVLIIGDYTARIGDPSGRSELRKPLSEKEVKENMKKYLKQASKVLNIKKTEVHYNSKWLNKKVEIIVELSKIGTIQQVLHRADFKKRISEGHDITLLEMLYPLFQGYDSVQVKADVEIGGIDQKFNLLMGRRAQRYFGQKEQDIILLPLLEGTDGVKKMSKSYNNSIALDAEPLDMFGKIMTIPDALIDRYYLLLTDEKRDIRNPKEAKLKLAKIIVSMYHGNKAAKTAEQEFIRIFTKKQLPAKIPQARIKKGEYLLPELLFKFKLAASKGEAKRLIEQGAVEINNQVIKDWGAPLKIEGNIVLKVGKRRFQELTII